MNGHIFITGATGFLGTELTARLITDTDKTVYVLLRAKTLEDALHRLKTIWWEEKALYQAIGHRVIPVLGDITQENLGLSDKDAILLQKNVDYVIHAAAETGIYHSKETLWRINVDGTQHVLEFAKKIDAVHGLKQFAHISTAYVAGARQGVITETYEPAQQYSTLYEESKACAEAFVLKAKLPYAIYRPSMIVGNSITGRIRNFNTVYYILKLLLTGKLKLNWIPVSKTQKINIVPVDYVAESIVRLLQHPQAVHQIFHLTAPDAMAPTAQQLANRAAVWAKNNLQFDLGRVWCIPLPFLKGFGMKHNTAPEEKKKNAHSNLLALIPYFYAKHQFDNSNTERLLGAYSYQWQAYVDRLLDYACRKNFMHQTGRNVFAQAYTRRSSEKHQILYYDVTADGMREYSGTELNDKIRQIAGALCAMGIQKGDRVAMAGINCVDYLALDMAIGMVGAVSVPIYYTTPIAEIALLLNKSTSKCFFVGDKRIMRGIDLLTATVPIISFANAQNESVNRTDIISWDTFLSVQSDAWVNTKINPDDLATIRYTSGTTGEPKGVMFQYDQLRWMGEVLTNLLSWKERNKEMCYLSFLPMSHVVEGILAAYAPYYMLADTKLYYLNDFDSLTDVLPVVRPTVFFSVPRFYEKLWQQLAQNKIGHRYIQMQDGIAKKMLGKILKRIILKKAGLDRCSQLIVGSAPMSEDLMLKFRALGIEIHNAYGQTEAPLITINRLGDNVIPSIGTPLPETTVTINEDGELIVTGPQVACGYDNFDNETIQNHVLRTGDLGSIDDTGHIFISGRKKDMVITSYGKNINCQKIETMLKDLDGVEEAVLIGEHRPYCTALLWLNDQIEGLAEQITQMNQNLSHPEQIKKWCVIDTPLSISKGELTPNLKVRKNTVMQHYQQEIEAMYQKEA